ncbi:UPF0236 family protein [Aerococcaceae bacterium zg-ZUI334]|nr:UPF0236 family protein [Aerococcaceae bacterium zg-ZUI334]
MHRYQAQDVFSTPTTKKQVPYLYIEADEDHVAYQDGKNREMRLVYIHEGYNSNESGGRRKLAIQRAFTGLYEKKTDELWDNVSHYLEQHYDTTTCKKIYLSRDVNCIL